MKRLAIYTSLVFTFWAQAQEVAVSEGGEHVKTWAMQIHEMDSGELLVYIMLAITVLAALLTTSVLISTVIKLLNVSNRAQGLPEIDLWSDLKKRFITGDVLPADQSDEIKLSHSYDGIVELDNTMPPWLRAVFGVTIAIAIGYMGYYYVLGLGKFQVQEYKEEMDVAALEIAEYQKKAANAINEENVVQEKDATALAGAKELFAKNCKTCHGANAEGGAGPNLTDAYWLHGGAVKDIFKTIKYGVPAKGMIAWQQKLTPKDIQGLTGYIMSLQGSNPAGAKAPQGELLGGANVAPSVISDSVAVSSDTVVVK